MHEKKTISDFIFKLLLIIITSFFIWPIYWMITGSFKSMTVALQIPPEIIPLSPTFRNYTVLLANYPVIKWFFNSCLIAIVKTSLVILFSSMAAYSLAKIKFHGSRIVFAMMISAMTLPIVVLFIPLFQMINSMGLSNKYLGAILPALGGSFGVFLLKQFMQTLPGSLLDSGRIDGCNELGLFTRIILPLSKPGLGALAIFTFVASWNDYVWQLIVLTDIKMFTLPLGIQITLKLNEMDTDYGRSMAGAMMATIPVLIVFIIFQRYFTKGITLGAVKG